MYCSQCGTKISGNSYLCEHCGSSISNTRREISINNGRPIPKSETHQSKRKQVLIVLGIISLIVGLLVFIFSFEKSEINKPTPPVKTIIPKSTGETVVPKSTNETIIPKSPDKTVVPKSTDETIIPKSTGETVVPKSTDETIIPKSTDETVVPTPPSSSSD
jgi:cytoskeletal protein RodZ